MKVVIMLLCAFTQHGFYEIKLEIEGNAGMVTQSMTSLGL